MVFLAKIYVTLKPAVNDPQGLTIQSGLHTLGFSAVKQVRMGKYLEVQLEERDYAAAQAQVEKMCRELLANPIIEEFYFELEDLASTTAEA